MKSMEYEASWAFGANCGNGDVNAIAKLIDQCNDYGFDTIEMGNVVSVYQEACQKGYANGGSLECRDAEVMVALVDQIAQREGVWDQLAEGPASAAESFGHGGDRDVGQTSGHPGL